ncbi:fat-like cadherin-related tumor suppressor homolog [Esox lucius]|uniref:fat-like cadherin-related tumor suppressor homolog n=1 Tax=Esox lucius TaxID=8010 RepID=UPI0014772848|nr:fat-like cadherin-related tumor suppressor homolog [Esox lucius]
MTKRMGYRDWRSLPLWWHHFFLLWITIDGQTRYTIPEELKRGSVVGNLAKDLGLGLSEIFDRKLRVASDADEHYFSVEAGKGELVVNERIDRETLCEQEIRCVLPLQVIIDSPLQLYRVEVEIQDINDNGPVFAKTEHVLNIAESTVAGKRFPLKSAEDPDVGTNALKNYKLNQNEHFILNIKSNKDGVKIPELVLQKGLDREKLSVHYLVLTALDGGNPVRSGTTEITVNVLDNNDNAPQFEKMLYEMSVREDSEKGKVIVKVKAIDIDDGENGEVVYSFAEDTSKTTLNTFLINSETGAISVKDVLDYERSKKYEFDIRANDKGTPVMDSHCTVHIDIQDINDNSPEILLTSVSSPVREDSLIGTVVALISAKDIDSGNNGKTSLTLSTRCPFKLKPSFSDHYALVTDSKLDREEKAEYTITILASDAGSPPLTAVKEISVGILDVNDNPPVFSQPSYTVHVKENYAPGIILCSVSATDQDLMDNAKISYSILDSKVQDVSVSSYVYINSDNGTIYSMHSFDYEKLKVFQILVQAMDHGSPSLSSNVTVHVYILDQNDNTPAVIYPSAALGSLSHQRMPRFAKAGHLVTKVTAVDADSGHNAWISYKLVEATDSSLFSVNQYTGEVRTKRALSEQDDSSQRLLIEIKDDGEPIQSATITVAILVEHGLQEPILDLRQKAPETSKKSGRITLYLILSLASVSVLSLLTFVILAVKCVRNGRNGGSCCMRLDDIDSYKNPNRNLQIQLNTDGPIKYVEVLGGDMLSQSQSFRSCLSPMSEFSDFTFVKPSSTTDFKEMINVLDASLPDSAWTFESQQVSSAFLTLISVDKVFASDLDFGDNAKISYSIIDSKVQDVSVSSYVYINSDNGTIYSMHSFDYEKLKVFQILVQAMDHGSPSLSSNVTVHVFILDQNDNAPAVIYPSAALGSLSHQRMPRSAKAGHLVTKVTAVDADSGHNAWISYKLVEATDSSLFSVNQYTGEVRTKRALSEQDDSSQRLLIEIKDDGDSVQSATVTVAILIEDGIQEPILDLRQKAPEASKKSGRITLYLILSLASVSVLSLLTFVIIVVKCVRNRRSSGSCCLTPDDFDSYKNPNRNLQIQLNTDGPIKYVEVLGGDMLSQSQSFRSCLSPMSEFSDFTFVKPSSTTDFKEMINVLDASLPDSAWTFESQQVVIENPLQLYRIEVEIRDINDNSPSFFTKELTLKIAESTATVSASDLDFGDNAKISYSILDSKVQDVSVSSYVYINSDNGTIYSMHSFDYEKIKVFKILVQAMDHGSPSLSSNVTVHVFILDQNDNAPAVIYPSAALGSLSHQRMPRFAKAGHLVTKVTAVDADSGHNAWISYKLVEATDSSLFSVNQYTGEVRTKRALSEQDDSSQRLLIEIKDDGDSVQSATVTVAILIEDGIQEPILDLRQKATEASKKSGRITLYLVLSLASVSVLSLLTFVILVVKCIRNKRSSGSCCFRLDDFDGYKNPNRNLQIQLNTDGPIKYVEVLGGDVLSQSHSFRSCLSPMSEFSDFTFVKPSSTTDFKEMINVLDASLPDNAWTFESQQVSS